MVSLMVCQRIILWMTLHLFFIFALLYLYLFVSPACSLRIRAFERFLLLIWIKRLQNTSKCILIPAQIQDKQMLWNGFKDTSKAAVQHGLHSQIISFTDMHEWTKCASMCAWLSLCVRKDLFASLESFYNMEAAAVPYSFLRKQPPCIRLIYTCLSDRP